MANMLKFLSLLLLSPVLGAGKNEFLLPPAWADKNPKYKTGDLLEIQWSTNWKVYSLWLWQIGTNKGKRIQGSLHGVSSYGWTVSTVGDLTQTDVFVLQVINENNSDYFICHSFNILENKATTARLPSTTSMNTSTISSTAIGASPTQACLTTPTGSSDQCDEAGLTPKTKVGIGVGVGLGCAFLMAMAAIIWYFRRRQKDSNASNAPLAWSPPDPSQNPSKQGPITQQPRFPVEVPGDFAVEAPSDHVRYELPS
ncbi:uncharacterized protein ASPGLDRAFT_27081 [Aspergillus glaucus CBS 516.65]|uniref:Mid2 domain-containing protein n=1 Tax=Aspergillus glaucus CBS 516.65 TaxID=1160497 RepID=A0A1L9VG22_ASPGL|nr:hypothetical protein ASPGLDRAFT_27081 [Aspergillus glaucus CBS 516.65]OJJ82844.1 hypothetical protein ASPGLDRAFT_27081 [Aspergillus glaucus CBS 516.65]